MNYLEITDVTKRYDGHTALENVSLNVKEGAIYGLLGPNGAGKTSLIRILNRITHQDSGRVLFNGHELMDADVAHIGYLPEERGLYKKMKLGEQIVYLARLKGMSRNDANTEMRRWLKRFDLEQWKDKKLETLSKGMAQKAQFIATVIHRPDLMIFDEPFSGFDPVNAELLKQEILGLGKEGATIIFSTHNMASVETLCEEITLINHAKVVLSGPVMQIRQKYKKNLYRVHIVDAPLAPNEALYTIEEIKVHKLGGTDALIRINQDVPVKQVIASLNEQYALGGFEELLPTMNEVFIETVTGKSYREGGELK